MSSLERPKPDLVLDFSDSESLILNHREERFGSHVLRVVVITLNDDGTIQNVLPKVTDRIQIIRHSLADYYYVQEIRASSKLLLLTNAIMTDLVNAEIKILQYPSDPGMLYNVPTATFDTVHKIAQGDRLYIKSYQRIAYVTSVKNNNCDLALDTQNAPVLSNEK
jgi:hypothetical protein